MDADKIRDAFNFGERKVVFKALVGSHNYNLNDETSDKDYKYFVLPTFDDLYTGKMFSQSKVGMKYDYGVHDIRKLVDLFWKANINFIEVLYSKEIQLARVVHYMKVESGAGKTIFTEPKSIDFKYPIMNDIFDMRHELVTMNLPYLFKACKGMYFEKLKRLEKGTEGTQGLVDKFGYDTKQALHAYRVMNFCVRFLQSDWDFNAAFRYGDKRKEELLNIKYGIYSLEEIKEFLDEYYQNVFIKIEPEYERMRPNETTRDTLYSLVKTLVKENL